MLHLLAETHANVSVWKDYLSVLLDPAHIGAEVTMTIVQDVIIGLVLWPMAKKAVRNHDKKVHGND